MREGGGCAVSDRRMLRAAGHPAVPSLRRSREMAGTYLGDGGGFGPDGNSSSEECAKDSARVHLASFHLLQPLIVYVDELLELFHLLLLRKAVSLELARNGVIRYWQRGW